MDINDAIKAAQAIFDLDLPETAAARNRWFKDGGKDNVVVHVEALEQFLDDVRDKIEGLRELVDELQEADKEDVPDFAANVQGAAEEVRNALT